ncbi:MAG: ATP-dependent DNA helicase RecG [Candidatus Nomurabacteria bacterium]|jgi:ATP-dependent DNA helicase RecG|nr:ATP-dependent DNA helicase RecG [Candidatus Nomurabacteria bacterium]
MNLSAPLSDIKGVGEKTVAKLDRAGLKTIRDLLYYLPRDHEDFSRAQSIKDVKPGRVIVRATVSNVKLSRKRRGLTITEATLSDATGRMRATWFNQPYRRTQFIDGKEYYFSGNFEFSYGRYQLMNPSAELAEDHAERSDEITPIYRASYDLKPKQIRAILRNLELYVPLVSEYLPERLVASEKLISRADALRFIHFPENEAQIAQARERLAFDELFELLLASELNKRENNKLKAAAIPFDLAATKEFVASLPFKLTNSQRVAAWDIIKDLEKPTPMNRLLQGDVGSGKTVVAGLVACLATKSGYQTAIMAPTEVLANQHAETLVELLEPFGVSVALLTGSTKKKQLIYERMASGEAQVIVGTHTLITKKAIYYKLGLVVVDEQHRFGVKQRQELLLKCGALMPHLLSMTATPIPRSLQLTVFGDLDISTLSDMPAGRKPIKTELVSPNSLDGLHRKVEAELARGHQAYYVCPLIESADPDAEAKSVKKEYLRLKNVFKGYVVDFLHGKLPADEKAQKLLDFAAGKTRLLVSTTVIEVGVNVPNATVIVVADADKFGLAQLHQLRGRVGRSSTQSYCFLVTSTSAKPTQRLLEVEKSTDGFYLAERDLELRGPGEIYGRMQHGDLDLQVAKLGDTKLVAKASRSARLFIESGENLLEYKELYARVQKYQKLTTLN